MELILESQQITHAERLLECLDNHGLCFDVSTMGTGKTYIHMYIAKQLNLRLVVVCPAQMVKVWTKLTNEYRIVTSDGKEPLIVSYESFRSTKNSQPKHGLLTRAEGKTTTFHTTPKGRKLLKDGIYFVMDEFQNVRNKSTQHDAVLAFLKTLHRIRDSTMTKFAFLSATPFDKPDRVIQITNLCGYTTGVKGDIKRIVQVAERVNQNRMDYFMEDNSVPTQDPGHKFLFSIFQDVILPVVSSGMTAEYTESSQEIKNLFCTLPRDEQTRYNIMMKALENDVKTKAFGKSVKALINLQVSKVPTIVRLVNNVLNTQPNAKVVIFADYHQVYDELIERFRVPVLELSGRTKNRSDVIAKFQEQNTEHRLLISHPKVGGVGIGLHDTSGEFPRVAFVMPGYNAIDLHQATGRFERRGSKGVSQVRFVYGGDGQKEQQLLEKLASKGTVMKDLVGAHYEATFCNSYPNILEKDDAFKQSPVARSRTKLVDLTGDMDAVTSWLTELSV